MPPLSNARHELFAQELAKGKSQTQAYIAAGYAEDGAEFSASRLLRNVKVQSRVEELQERAARKVDLTVDDIVRELEEARKVATDNAQSNAMVAATMGKAKILGLIIEKTEDVTQKPRLDEVNAKIAEFVMATKAKDNQASLN